MAGVIVVGIDQRGGSLAAAEWAAAQAQLRGAQLLLVTATGGREPVLSQRLSWREKTAAFAERWPDLDIHESVILSRPDTALIEASSEADLVVIGSNGQADVSRSIFGGVAHTVGAHTYSPVVVVPATAIPSDGPVVAGAVLTPAGCLALWSAIDEAQRRDCLLRVVIARSEPSGIPRLRRLIDAVQSEGGTQLEVIWSDAEPVDAVVDAARGASLVVLGCHHSTDRYFARLGSVPTGVLGRVHCPVEIVGQTAGPVLGHTSSLTYALRGASTANY